MVRYKKYISIFAWKTHAQVIVDKKLKTEQIILFYGTWVQVELVHNAGNDMLYEISYMAHASSLFVMNRVDMVTAAITTVEPPLSKLHGRHTISVDKREGQTDGVASEMTIDRVYGG